MHYESLRSRPLAIFNRIETRGEAVHWPSLTELKLEDVELHQQVIEKILSGCPALHSLFLRHCWRYNSFEINSQCLYELTVVDPKDDDEPLLKISAPYVRHLGIKLYPFRRKLHLTSIPSVISVDIDFNGFVWNCISEELMSNVKELLEKTKHVEALKLGPTLADAVLMLAKGALPQSRRRWLTIKVEFTEKHGISGITGLLESSPNIESLGLDISLIFYDLEELVTGGPSARDDDLHCNLLHLKTVKIKYCADAYASSDQMLTLARILLKRATVLEEMVIVTDLEDMSDFVKISQTLLTYPRSSQKAVVVLR